MAAYFNLTLDTTAPSGGSIIFGVSITNIRTVTATLSATDAAAMKLYGDIGTGSTPTADGDASWETYSASKSVQLTSGDGTKTVYVKFRDAVGNASTAASATITLDTSAAVVNITGPDVSTVSKVAGYNVSEFSFSADAPFVEYKVKVVPSTSSSHDVGTQIPMTAGSTNMSGTGTYVALTPVTCTINAADLETASSGDGLKIVKVFVKDTAGNWSV